MVNSITIIGNPRLPPKKWRITDVHSNDSVSVSVFRNTYVFWKRRSRCITMIYQWSVSVWCSWYLLRPCFNALVKNSCCRDIQTPKRNNAVQSINFETFEDPFVVALTRCRLRCKFWCVLVTFVRYSNAHDYNTSVLGTYKH